MSTDPTAGNVDTNPINLADAVSSQLDQILHIPSDVASLLPQHSVQSITDLLESSKFTHKFHTAPKINPSACYSLQQPTQTSLECLLYERLPPKSFLEKVRSASRQAMVEGKVSFCHWSMPNSRFPFYAVPFLQQVVEAALAKTAWMRAISWINQRSFSSDVKERINILLKSIRWTGMLSSGCLEVTAGALFLSSQMLTDDHVDAMHALISARIQSMNPVPEHLHSVVIGDTWIGQSWIGISSYLDAYTSGSATEPTCLTTLAEQLNDKQYPMRDVWMALHSPPLHYGAMHMHKSLSELVVNWADSIRRPFPHSMKAGLCAWAKRHLPNHRVVFQETLHCPQQTDSISCSIISINTLEHHLFSAPLWTDTDPHLERCLAFLRVFEHHLQLMQPDVAISHYPNVVEGSGDIEMADGTGTAGIITPLADDLPVMDVARDPSSPHQSAAPSPPSKSSVPKSGRIDSFFTLRGKPADVSLSEKKQRNRAPTLSSAPVQKKQRKRAPSSATATEEAVADSSKTRSKKPSKSRPARSSAQAKQTLNRSILEGTLVIDAVKWARYKDKLGLIDPYFVVYESASEKARLVRHSRCGKDITVASLYEVSRFREHVLKCNEKTPPDPSISNMRTISAYMEEQKPEQVSPKSRAVRSIQPGIQKMPCPGISAIHDPRINQYLLRTEAGSGGGQSGLVIAQETYSKSYSSLTAKQKKVVDLKQRQTHTWRLDHPNGAVFAIGANPCLRAAASNSDNDAITPCASCMSLLSNNAFQVAINKPVPKDKDRVYVPHKYQNAAIGEMHAKGRGLKELLSEENKDNIFGRFATRFAEGKFKDEPVFMGLMEVIVSRMERDEKGRGLQNMKYPPAYDQWCHQLFCIRPEAYRSFKDTFGGRTERSFLKLRSSKPAFMQGFGSHTTARARQYLSDYGYPSDGPLGTGVDDTKLLQSLNPYYDGSTKKWYIIGTTGEPMEVSDIDLLEEQLKSARDKRAPKLRLWTLVIPLPNVPPLILAAVPLTSKTTAIELAILEEEMLKLLLDAPENFNIVSLASDGASTEREARRQLLRRNFAQAVHMHIPDPRGGTPLVIELYKIRNRLMVPIQDSKHLRKTARNNLYSGARTLVLGNWPIFYEHICNVAFEGKKSPLYIRDVEKLDRQDDRAAARLFSAATLEFLANQQAQNLGLAVYLFVFGDLVDAYQSRTMSHFDRAKAAYRAKFFKDMWREFLKDANYDCARHFISREANDIIDILINGVLGLIVIYRDSLGGRFALLPWKKATEANEHVFGFLRMQVSDFSMLDVLRLVPKITVQLQAACRAKLGRAAFQKTAAGYMHTYGYDKEIDLRLLSDFPDNSRLEAAAVVGHDEAATLWELLGYYGSTSEGSVDALNDLPDDGDPDLGLLDAEEQISDRQELQNALDAAANISVDRERDEETLNQCTFAAASLNFAELEKIESLPDSDPEALAEIKEQIAQCLAFLASRGPTGINAVRDLLQVDNFQQSQLQATTTHGPSRRFDLSPYVRARWANQSPESVKSVRVTTAESSFDTLTETDKSATSNTPSERQLLARKIYATLRLDKEQGISTGLNRNVRYGKSAAGSTQASSDATSGNIANAQIAARIGAAAVVTSRRQQFKDISFDGDLSSAGISDLTKIRKGTFGFVLIDDQIMIAEALTMYQRGGGKAAKHSWVSEADTIGALSYISTKVFQHQRTCTFRSACGRKQSMTMPRFYHLSTAEFLHLVPPTAINIQSDEAEDLQKTQLAAAVKKLMGPGRGHKAHELDDVAD